MKVIKTIHAADTNGHAIDFLHPNELKVYEGDSLIEATHAVVQSIADTETERFIKTTSIRIEL